MVYAAENPLRAVGGWLISKVRIMKASAFLVLGVLCIGPAFADDAPIHLICTGFRFELGPVRRQITIYADRADIDGHLYRRIQSETNFVLVGPEPKENVEVQISRLDGGYFFNSLPSPPPGVTGRALEISRADHGEGCKKAEMLF
jgi:hypothetical protein